MALTYPGSGTCVTIEYTGAYDVMICVLTGRFTKDVLVAVVVAVDKVWVTNAVAVTVVDPIVVV